MKHNENIDAAEISKFESQSHLWWDKNGDYKPLHDINPARIPYINERASLQDKTVLDIGCGGGILSEAMAALGATVTGIDPGEAQIKAARSHMIETGHKVSYLKMTAEAMAETTPSSFDVITCLEMLEHVPDPLSVIKASRKLVKPGGHVFFATLNRNPKAFLFAIIGAEYLLGLIPRGTHTYRRFIKPSEMAGWIRHSGLVLQDMTGMHYNPVFRTCYLGGNLHVNYLVHATRP